MTWFAQAANETESAREHVAMFVAVDFDFSSGHCRLWTGYGDLTINGSTFTGAGTMGSISMMPETARLLSEKKQYRLSGVDPTLVTEADIDACFGRSVIEYFGFLTAAGALVATPEISWEGRIDAVSRVDSAEPYIQVMAQNRMVFLDQANGWRYTHEHQQQFFAGDDGLKLVPTVMTSDVAWGGKKVVPGSNPRGGKGRFTNFGD